MALKIHNKVKIMLKIPKKQPETTGFLDKFPSFSNSITFVHFIFSAKCNLIGPRTVVIRSEKGKKLKIRPNSHHQTA